MLTDPTTGRRLGLLRHAGRRPLAEPDALIGFAGPRVIQDTIRQELPPGFQRAEYLLEHGMVDAVVHRHKLRETLIRLVSLLMDPLVSESREPGRRRQADAVATVADRSIRCSSGSCGFIRGRSTSGWSGSSGCWPALGSPHRKLPPVVHVAGTNGKGSLVAYLRAMAEAAGYRVHVYTSPHLVRFNERIRVAGQLIDDATLDAILTECEEANREQPITFFEITTVAAFSPSRACRPISH